jgi:putative transcription regulator (tetR family)
MIELAVGKNKHILKERILKHATMLFYANGVKMIKMDTIAKDLSISKKTLYLFFPTKEDLCLACLVKEKEALCKHMELYKQNWKS